MVSGKVSNTTALPIRCTRVDPISASLGLSFSTTLPPGGSETFSKNDVISQTNLSASGISAWKAVCLTPLSYTFVSAVSEKTFPWGTVKAVIGRTQIAIAAENNSDEPIEILWNDSSFIDVTRIVVPRIQTRQ
jgi:hypothetical protein